MLRHMAWPGLLVDPIVKIFADAEISQVLQVAGRVVRILEGMNKWS